MIFSSTQSRSLGEYHIGKGNAVIEQHSSQLYRLTEGLEAAEYMEVPLEFSESLPGDCLLAYFGIELRKVGRARAYAAMTIARHHLNQRGIAQAGAVTALADATRVGQVTV